MNINIKNITPIKILAVTPIRDEFDLNGSIKTHFSLIRLILRDAAHT